MALLVFSNNGNWDSDVIGLSGVISTEEVINKGIIQSVQEYIRDDDVLDEMFEDEHKGLDVKVDDGELDEILERLEMDFISNIEPTHFVNFPTSRREWLYIIIKI